jgi:tripartite-type tricarboxylate transporter receptor subunit TctC
VKTLREQGYDAVTRGPLGYAFPAGVEPAIRAKVEAAIGTALADPAVRQRFQALGVVPRFRPAAEFKALLKSMDPDIYEVLKENNMLKKS